MNYNNKYVTQPFTNDLELQMDSGDSYFMGLRQWTGITPQIDTFVEPAFIQALPHIYIESALEQCVGVVPEGSNITVTVKSDRNVLVDTTVDYTIAGTTDVPQAWMLDPNCTEDYDSTSVLTSATITDIPTLTGQAVILADTDSITFDIVTVDDTIFTGGINSYRSFSVTLSNPDNPLFVVKDDTISYGLLADTTPLPVVEGQVLVSVRMDDLLGWEPLEQPSEPTQQGFTLGNDANGNSLIRSLQVDDIPLRRVRFEPQEFVASDASDITGGNLYYQMVVYTGRRQ